MFIVIYTAIGLLFPLGALATFIGSIVLLVKERDKLPKGQTSEDPFTGNQKLLVLLMSIFNPVLCGAILYYGLKSRFPIKAKTANRLSFIGLLIATVIVFSLIFFIGRTDATK